MKAGRARRPAAPALAAPPMPELADDRERFATTGSAQAAWWIAGQVAEHMFGAILERDPRTGAPLPSSLDELLAALRTAAATGRRPLPRDALALAAETASEVVPDLLRTHRTRVVREHVQLPFPSLREVDGRSLAWLSRQPGRTVREKLAGRTRALGVRRTRSADTAENRLLRALAARITRQVRARLEGRDAYDAGPRDDGRAEVLAAALAACDERLRRSELAEVPARAPGRPNNVLLSDPLYTRLYREWRRLRALDEGAAAYWEHTPVRVFSALAWLVVAELAEREGTRLLNAPACVSLDGDFTDHRGHPLDGADLLLLPDGRDPVRSVRIRLRGAILFAEVAPLLGRGRLAANGSEKLSFLLQLHGAPAEPGRGAPLQVDPGGVHPADLEGLRAHAKTIVDAVLGAARLWRPSRPSAVTAAPVEGPMGLELEDTRLAVHAGGAVALSALGWSGAWDIEAGLAGAWVDGRAGLLLADAGRVLSVGEAFDDEAGEEALREAALRRVVDQARHELGDPGRVAYTLPDAGDTFSQAAVRAAIEGSLSGARPVWRSVAAALAWQARDVSLRPGNSLLVLDLAFDALTPTLLVAREDGRLAFGRPASRGLYWERKPAFAAEEDREALGWRRQRAQYAEYLVRRAMGDEDPERLAALAARVAQTDTLDAVVTGGVAWLAFGDGALEVRHDDDAFRRGVADWLARVCRSAEALCREIPPVNHVLLVGGPSDLPGLAAYAEGLLRERVGGGVTWLPPGTLAAGAAECRARYDESLLAWKEYLPDLWLEIVSNGHFAELPLIDGNHLVEPFLGRPVTFDVPQPLVLPAGARWYSFPVILGRREHRPLSWEARLESAAFPLAKDTPVRLTLSYAYGVESTYALTLEPVEPGAGLGRVDARWARGGDRDVPAERQDAPSFLLGRWSAKEVKDVGDVLDGLARGRLADGGFQRFAGIVTRKCWDQGRCASNAPEGVRRVVPALVATLVKGLQAPTAARPGPGRAPEPPIALQLLCQLHEDAPDGAIRAALELDRAAGDDPQGPVVGTLRLLSAVVGDGRGPRAAALDRLLERLAQAMGRNLGLERRVNAAIKHALLRNPSLIATLADRPREARLLVERNRRSLATLLRNVPAAATTPEDRERIAKVYAGVYTDATETLLALLPLRAGLLGTALRRGSVTADATDKAVRQLDARFVRMGVELRWKIKVDARVPEALLRMSKPAYVLHRYLGDEAGGDLAVVTGAEGE